MSVYESQEKQNDSFFKECSQNADLAPYQLSGDENSQSIIATASFASSKKSNFLLTVTTIMKTVIGAGILSLPFAVSKLGYLLSVIVFALILIVNQFTCIVLLKDKNLSHHSNYTSISYHIFKSKIIQALAALAILLNNIGICIIELTILKGTIRKLLEENIEHQYLDYFYTQQWFAVFMVSILLIPFTLVSKIQRLKFFSFIGVSGICIFIISLFINFIAKATSETSFCQMNAFPTNWGEALTVIPTVLLAVAYHMNFFPIFKGLKNSSDAKMAKASLVGMGTCTLFYLIVGVIGSTLYSCHPELIQGNFLKTIRKEDVEFYLYILLNGSFSVSVFFSFPIMFFGARNNFIALIKMIKIKDMLPSRSVHADTIEEISSFIQVGNQNQKKIKARILFYILTMFLFCFAIAVTILVTQIEQVFNIVGAVASNSIALIFPTLFYIFLIRKKSKPMTKTYFISMGVLIFAIPFGISAVVLQYV